MKDVNAIKLFNQPQVRHHWDEAQKLWYFAVIDVIKILTQNPNPNRYWKALQIKLTKEGSSIVKSIKKIEIKLEDGQSQIIEAANTQTLLRIIQSINNPKAEPLKLWLAQTGFDRMQEVEDPEKAFDRAMETYLKKGYNIKWINQRLKSIEIRKELAGEWQKRGIKVDEFRVLTDQITKAWSGKTTREYKDYKGLNNQNLRDNMTSLELVLNMLGEMSTAEISKVQKPQGLVKNKKVARSGGKVAKKARLEIEKQIGQSVISGSNAQRTKRL